MTKATFKNRLLLAMFKAIVEISGMFTKFSLKNIPFYRFHAIALLMKLTFVETEGKFFLS